LVELGCCYGLWSGEGCLWWDVMATSEEKGSVQMGFFFNNDGGG